MAIVRHDQLGLPVRLGVLGQGAGSHEALPCGFVGLRPRPSRTSPSLASPACAKRPRQACTVDASAPARSDPRVHHARSGQQQRLSTLNLAMRSSLRPSKHLMGLSLAIGHDQEAASVITHRACSRIGTLFGDAAGSGAERR